MNSHFNVRAAVFARLSELDLGIAASYPNMPFDTPSSDTPWAKITYLHGGTEPVTLGDQGEDEHTGILQIDLNYPLYKGEADVTRKADEIATHFAAGRRGLYAGQEVVFNGVSRTGGESADGWWRVIMSISWFAHAPRN